MKTLLDISTTTGAWVSNELETVSSVMSEHLKNKHQMSQFVDERVTVHSPEDELIVVIKCESHEGVSCASGLSCARER